MGESFRLSFEISSDTIASAWGSKALSPQFPVEFASAQNPDERELLGRSNVHALWIATAKMRLLADLKFFCWVHPAEKFSVEGALPDGAATYLLDLTNKLRSDKANAGGITTAPNRRNLQNPTRSPSRRIATNQRMVANDPVTERFGPRSIPMSTESRIGPTAPAAFTAAPVISPLGRLLVRFESTAI